MNIENFEKARDIQDKISIEMDELRTIEGIRDIGDGTIVKIYNTSPKDPESKIVSTFEACGTFSKEVFAFMIKVKSEKIAELNSQFSKL